MSENKEVEQPIGVDLIGFKPDYNKSDKENEKIYREKYKEVYGEYPPEEKGEGD